MARAGGGQGETRQPGDIHVIPPFKFISVSILCCSQHIDILAMIHTVVMFGSILCFIWATELNNLDEGVYNSGSGD